MALSKLTLLFIFASSLLGASIAALSTGCSKALPQGQTLGSSSTVDYTQKDGTDRSYRIHIPSNYGDSSARELIFSFHGRGSSAKEQEDISQFSDPLVNPDGIAVYPEGLDAAWQGAPYSRDGVDDIAFVDELIDSLSSTYCIDTKRIYASGMSNGGGFTGTLACSKTVNSKIAAFAPVSGAFYVNTGSKASCHPNSLRYPCDITSARHVPIIEFHGDKDETIPYLGKYKDWCLPNITHWVDQISHYNGLGITPYKEIKLHKSTNPGNVTRLRFPNDINDAAFGTVTHYKTGGLGHRWPTKSVTSYDASPIIMEFFGNHTL